MKRIASAVSVEEGYERWAATYDRDPNPLLAREERHLFSLVAGAQNSRILDLACGTGRWIALLCERSAYGVGIDSSTAMLQVARQKRPAMGQFIQGTGERLPFCDSAFDLAICSFALGHMRDLSSVARELSRVLESGSNLFISDLHPEAISRGWRVGFRGEAEAYEIENQPHQTNEVVQSFCREHFECLSQESLWLGDPERPLFEQSGKTDYFQDACVIPAVIVFHFKRNAQPVTPGIC